MITVQFSRKRDPFSALIRWFTWSQYSHVDLVLPDGRLLGATALRGVDIREPEDFEAVKRFTVDAPTDVLKLASLQVGKPYDWPGIFGIVGRHDWQDPSRWFCSELVAWAFQSAGVPLLRGDRSHRITPRDLLLSPLLYETQE